VRPDATCDEDRTDQGHQKDNRSQLEGQQEMIVIP
jgi:hypothetical protein